MVSTSSYELLHPYCQVSPTKVSSWLDLANPLAFEALGPNGPSKTKNGVLPVSTELVSNLIDSPYGLFMSAWPIVGDGSVTLCYLQDWTISLVLLRRIFEPIWCHQPDLETAFFDGSRLQVGIMNDVLQGFVDNPPVGTYCMIRHHALMLFEATLWLDPLKRSRWLTLYKAIAEWVKAHWIYRDLKGYLDTMEAEAFSVFTHMKNLTVPQILAALDQPYIEYTLTQYFQAASLAVGVLAVGYEHVQFERQKEWLVSHIIHYHQSPDYLLEAIDRYICHNLIEIDRAW